MTSKENSIRIGWSQADITPEETVAVRGQFHARVSEGVSDPVTATALALESEGKDNKEAAVMVSCDLVGITDRLRDYVRESVAEQMPELNPNSIFLNATHTHTGPELSAVNDAIRSGLPSKISALYGTDLPVMPLEEYLEFAGDRISEAILTAWNNRRPGKVGFGLGHAVVGRNRRITYYSGESSMYGPINDPEFSHVEGYEDHSVNLMGTWDENDILTGLVVNLACPSQVSENEFRISADFWHETRQELRSRFGKNLFVLPQCSAAGDQSPHLPGNQCRNPERVEGRENPETRMWRLAERSQRREIAVRIADAAEACLPLMKKELTSNPTLSHIAEDVELSKANLTQQDVEDAERQAGEWKKKYMELKNELEENPDKRSEPRWYVSITKAYRRMKWFEGVGRRYERQKEQPEIPVEIHVLRIGDLVFATNPFEYYLDFGMRIKARSKAVQTFVVQLTGSGTYVPTKRAAQSGSYGAVPASTPVGFEGGRELVERTLKIINLMW